MSNDLKYIDDLVSSKLAGHAVESSGNTWAAVSRIAFWRNFLSFSFARFNIYYATLILFVGISGVLFMLFPEMYNSKDALNANNFNNSKILNESSEILIANRNETNNIAFKLIPNGNVFYSTLIDIQKKIKADSNNDNDKILARNITKTVKNRSRHEKKVIKNRSAKIINNNSVKAKAVVSNSKLSGSSVIQSKKDIATYEDMGRSEDMSKPEIFSKSFSTLKERNDFFNIEKLTNIDLITFNGFVLGENSSLLDLKLQSDSFDYFLPLEERSHWMMEYYISPIYSGNITGSSNAELKSFISEKNKVERPTLSFTSGLNIIYKSNRNFIFQTGIAYSQLGEFISRKDIQDINNYSYPLYPDGGFYNIDTIQFYNIDSLLQGIEYIETLYDSTWIVDNTIINESDTTVYKGVNNRNKYSYIDVPVIVGYSVPYRQFDLQFKAGVITSFMLNARGNKLNPENDKEFISLGSDSPEYRKVNYSFVSGFDLSYHMNERFDLVAGILYRKNLYNIYKTYPYSQKYYASELHLGLKFHL